jgi:hypothetical protein
MLIHPQPPGQGIQFPGGQGNKGILLIHERKGDNYGFYGFFGRFVRILYGQLHILYVQCAAVPALRFNQGRTGTVPQHPCGKGKGDKVIPGLKEGVRIPGPVQVNRIRLVPFSAPGAEFPQQFPLRPGKAAVIGNRRVVA